MLYKYLGRPTTNRQDWNFVSTEILRNEKQYFNLKVLKWLGCKVYLFHFPTSLLSSISFIWKFMIRFKFPLKRHCYSWIHFLNKHWVTASLTYSDIHFWRKCIKLPSHLLILMICSVQWSNYLENLNIFSKNQSMILLNQQQMSIKNVDSRRRNTLKHIVAIIHYQL